RKLEHRRRAQRAVEVAVEFGLGQSLEEGAGDDGGHAAHASSPAAARCRLATTRKIAPLYSAIPASTGRPRESVMSRSPAAMASASAGSATRTASTGEPEAGASTPRPLTYTRTVVLMALWG